jgi:hypothetical protein
MILEFHKTNEGVKLFLGAREHPIKKSDKTIAIILDTNGEKKEFIAYLFEGGQRLLASKELQEAILEALHNNITITLRCDTYRTTIHPEQFKQNFSKLFSRPLSLPIQFALE